MSLCYIDSGQLSGNGPVLQRSKVSSVRALQQLLSFIRSTPNHVKQLSRTRKVTNPRSQLRSQLKSPISKFQLDPIGSTYRDVEHRLAINNRPSLLLGLLLMAVASCSGTTPRLFAYATPTPKAAVSGKPKNAH